MHINHSGANINIGTNPNCTNNFIFNNTAPVNLNFYKDGKSKKLDDETIKSLDPEILKKLAELNDLDHEGLTKALKEANSDIQR
jgi:hypothetical protein